MPDHVSQPRLLLRRLHSVMGGDGSAQERLDRVVRVIAQNMVAEVCSVYLARAGSVLELFATEGLKEEAVHRTRLQVGEGLVGLVAERGLPLNLSEAPKHPRFAYRPETGEDIYHSFLGVPILRNGKVSGVLVVQNVTPRLYSPEEVEALQTISMVLAELVSSGELINIDELSEDTVELGHSITLNGLSLASGIAAGAAVFTKPKIRITKTIADDVEEERARLETSLGQMRRQLEEMLEHPDFAQGGEHREVLETYRLFAYDRGWQDKMREAIDSGLTAEAAVERVQQENRARMAKIRDHYLRERIQDFEDLAGRLIRIIQGETVNAPTKLTQDSVLVARTVGPAELMEFDRQYLKAVVLEEGSSTAHVTIIARAMGIPVMGQIPNLLSHVETGDEIVVDTAHNHVYVRPNDEVLQGYREAVKVQEQLFAEYAVERDLPAETLDGERVELLMNAGLLADLPSLDTTGAEGIGLFRTEFQFMVSPALPRVDEQTKVYSSVLDAAGDKPVVFRTLDIGGDKPVPFLPREHEENPAMGWRAIRVALERPALLRYQLRALLYAAAGRNLNVMFPMIAEVAELKKCKAILQKELQRLEKFGKTPPKEIKVGCMFEVPSLSWQLDSLLEEVDFLSIGTNDLLQFFFACDRSNPKLADRYDMLAPSVLSFLRMIISACHAADVPVTVCGEMGGRAVEAMALVALGLRKISVSPSSVGTVKRLLRSVDMNQLRAFLVEHIQSPEHSVRDSLLLFARDHNIKV